MKRFIFLVFLFSSISVYGQTKGFIRPEVSLKIGELIEERLTLFPCKAYDVEQNGKRTCKKFGEGQLILHNKVTPVLPGLYHLMIGSMHGVDLVEIKLAEVTTVHTKKVNSDSLEKLIPGLVNYSGYDKREYFISPNYLDPRNRELAERDLRNSFEIKWNGGCENQSFTIASLANQPKAWRCPKDGKNQLLPVTITEEAQALLERYYSHNPSKGIYLNDFDMYGGATFKTLRVFVREKEIEIRAGDEQTYNIGSLSPSYKDFEKSEALLPGKYIVTVDLNGFSDGGVVDVFPFELK